MKNVVFCAGLITLAAAAFLPAQTHAGTSPAVPRIVKFNGTLTGGSGQPLSGVVGVTFSLYAEESGGAPLWMETQNIQPDAVGNFTAMLGATRNEGIPAEVFAAGQGRWLGIQPQGESERSRVFIASVPYALKAVDADTLGGLPVSAFALAGAQAASSAHNPGDGHNNDGHNNVPDGAFRPADVQPTTVGGTGTANHLAYWTNSTTLSSSALYQTAAKKIGLGTTTPSTQLDVQTATATAILGNATATSGAFNGVNGQSSSSGGQGVFGTNTAASGGIGVLGTTAATSGFAVGVEGQSSSPTGNGVFGQNLATTGSAQGVVGFSASTNGNGVTGNALATSGNTNGVLGIASSPNGNGVFGTNNATSGFAVGVNGQTSSPNGTGVNGVNFATAGGNGVQGQSASTSGNGVFGANTATSGFAVGVNGQTASPAGTGINGLNLAAAGGNGVQGQSNATTGFANGVSGQSSSTGGNGVFGNNSATSGFAIGVNGQTSSPAGAGVFGVNTATIGGTGGSFTSNATSGNSNGVYGQSSSTNGNGVAGNATSTTGFAVGVSGQTQSSGGAGVFGFNNAASGGFGLDGQAGVNGIAVYGVNQTCNGSGCTLVAGTGGSFVTGSGGTVLQGFGGSYGNQVFKVDAAGNGFFKGSLNVVGTVSKGGGSFKIDHPLDPANKYLSHSFVESPDMMDIYNGVIRLDTKGQAWVNLPDYFEALNGDFRYQLTAIGAPAPRLYVAREVSQNHFKIAGGRPGGRVSWQVTGIRHDAYANAHRIPVTEEKPSAEQGRYLHPDAYGPRQAADGLN